MPHSGGLTVPQQGSPSFPVGLQPTDLIRGEGRDPWQRWAPAFAGETNGGKHNVLRLSPREQTVRYDLCRHDFRPRAANWGTQDQGGAWVHGALRSRPARLVRSPRVGRSSDAARTQIKEWKHDWKIKLIERDNPRWIDLYQSLS